MPQVTPLITVDAIEPCLSFWSETLGSEVSVSVPHGDALGFAMLQAGPAQLMYQTRASVEADLGASGAPPGLAAEMSSGTATLFIVVDDLDRVIGSLGESPVLVPRRRTFYGMDEVFVRAPCGTVVGFAASAADDPEETGA